MISLKFCKLWISQYCFNKIFWSYRYDFSHWIRTGLLILTGVTLASIPCSKGVNCTLPSTIFATVKSTSLVKAENENWEHLLHILVIFFFLDKYPYNKTCLSVDNLLLSLTWLKIDGTEEKINTIGLSFCPIVL